MDTFVGEQSIGTQYSITTAILSTLHQGIDRFKIAYSATGTGVIVGKSYPVEDKAPLTAEDREAREKGFALVAHVERLMQTAEGFHDWFQEGFDEIKAGHFVTFSEDGWKEE